LLKEADDIVQSGDNTDQIVTDPNQILAAHNFRTKQMEKKRLESILESVSGFNTGTAGNQRATCCDLWIIKRTI
jgi:hypothetical protein